MKVREIKEFQYTRANMSMREHVQRNMNCTRNCPDTYSHTYIIQYMYVVKFIVYSFYDKKFNVSEKITVTY